MKREFLKELGIDDNSVIDKIMDQVHQEHAELRTEKQTAVNERDGLKNQVQELTETIAKFDGVDLEALKAEPAQIKAQYEAQLNDMKIERAIEQALGNAKHSELLKSQIRKDNLSVKEDGKVEGLEEQMNTLKETYADFFTPVQKEATGPKPATSNAQPHTLTKEQILEEKNLSKRQQLIKENMELFTK